MVSEVDIAGWIGAQLAEMLDRPIDEIAATMTFEQLGIDSGLITNLLLALEDRLNIEVDPDTALDQPTIATLSKYACSLVGTRA
jgi:acyl carrier protein